MISTGKSTKKSTGKSIGKSTGESIRKSTRKSTEKLTKKSKMSGGNNNRGLLNIRYNNNIKIAGQELTISQTKNQPTVQQLPKNTYLIMYDPNAVKPSVIHWITSANDGDLLPYIGPAPPSGTGIHHYIFVLCKGNLSSSQIPKIRHSVDHRLLIKNPIAQTEFKIIS